MTEACQGSECAYPPTDAALWSAKAPTVLPTSALRLRLVRDHGAGTEGTEGTDGAEEFHRSACVVRESPFVATWANLQPWVDAVAESEVGGQTSL